MYPNSWLKLASAYAQLASGCTKVQVGCVILNSVHILALGANRTIPNLCKTRGCLRVEKYGDNHKTHRNPGDCRAIHAEIDAITKARQDLTGATMIITRYPCEECAKAIVNAGIKTVYYGRQQPISAQTQEIFDRCGVDVFHYKKYTEYDVEV